MSEELPAEGKSPGLESESILHPSSRHRVMLAMVELCAEQGYEETSAEQVAERGGVSVEEFGELFADREACLTAAAKAMLGEVMSVVSSAYSADRSEWDNGLFGIKAIVELMAARASFAHLSYIGTRQMAPPEAHAVYLAGVQVLTSMLDGLRGRRAEPPPRIAARAGFGSVEAVVRREIVAGRTEELPRLLPDFVYGATVAFIGQDNALWMARRARELLAGTEWEEA